MGGGTILRLYDDGIETCLTPKMSDPLTQNPDCARAEVILTCRPSRLWMRAKMLPGPVLTPPLLRAAWMAVEDKPDFDFFMCGPKQNNGASEFLALHSMPVVDSQSNTLCYAIFGLTLILATPCGDRLFVEAKMWNKAKDFARRN